VPLSALRLFSFGAGLWFRLCEVCRERLEVRVADFRLAREGHRRHALPHEKPDRLEVRSRRLTRVSAPWPDQNRNRRLIFTMNARF